MVRRPVLTLIKTIGWSPFLTLKKKKAPAWGM